MRRRGTERLAGSQHLRLIIRAVAAALLGCMTVMANPALANSTANADITEPLRQGQTGALTPGDEKFHQLFASWEALDRSGQRGSTLRPSLSIPSPLPLDGLSLTTAFGLHPTPTRKP